MIKPKVSILVPVYNVEKYIQRCIDSILSQSYSNIECILVNDCSLDNSLIICNDYSLKDSRIKVINKTKNEGLPYARKTGFEYSTGEYIQFVDSDDWIEPDMTQKLVSAAECNNADIVSCDYYLDFNNRYKYEVQILDTKNNFNNLGFIYTCSIWNKLYHRSIINRIIFPKAGKYEDRVITQQALFYANKIVTIPYPLYHYFQHPESSIRSFNIKKYYEWQENILFVINFLKNNLTIDQFKLKEANINDYVNKFKIKIIKSSLLRKEKKLIRFYPESNFYRKIPKYLFKYLIKNINKITGKYIQ